MSRSCKGELVATGQFVWVTIASAYAVIDSRGRVHPFHKPLEIRGQGDGRQTKIDVLKGVRGDADELVASVLTSAS